MKVTRVDPPITITKHPVWISKDEDESWGSLPDEVYRHRPFTPNTVCVIVNQSGEMYGAEWMQAREEHPWGSAAPERTRVVGTMGFDGSLYEWPEWAQRAARLAVEEAKKA